MGNRRRILVAALVLAALGGLAWRLFFRAEPEPVYQGKPLSYWFREYCRYGDYGNPVRSGYTVGDYPPKFSRYWPTRMSIRHPDSARGERGLRALCAIGTNAVPYLVTEALSTNQDSALATNLLPQLSARGFGVYVPREQKATAAYEALDAIQPPARVLLPYLAAALAETNTARHFYALDLLSVTGAGGEATVPYLRAALRSKRFTDQAYAAIAAGRIGVPVKDVVPDLVEVLQQRAPRGHLVWWAATALGNMGTNAAAATPALLAMLEKPEPIEWRSAGAALGKIGYDQQALVAGLTVRLDDAAPDNRLRAAVLILRVEPTNSAALSALIEVARAEPDLRRQAFQELGKLGSAAAPAIPLLREATTNIYTLRDVARAALRNIEAASATNSSNLKVVPPPRGAGK